VEAAQATIRTIPEWRSKYIHLVMRRGQKIAKVAMARKLAIASYAEGMNSTVIRGGGLPSSGQERSKRLTDWAEARVHAGRLISFLKQSGHMP